MCNERRKVERWKSQKIAPRAGRAPLGSPVPCEDLDFLPCSHRGVEGPEWASISLSCLASLLPLPYLYRCNYIKYHKHTWLMPLQQSILPTGAPIGGRGTEEAPRKCFQAATSNFSFSCSLLTAQPIEGIPLMDSIFDQHLWSTSWMSCWYWYIEDDSRAPAGERAAIPNSNSCRSRKALGSS